MTLSLCLHLNVGNIDPTSMRMGNKILLRILGLTASKSFPAGLVLMHSWEPNVCESFNSHILKGGNSWVLITFSNSTLRSRLNLTIVSKVQLGEKKAKRQSREKRSSTKLRGMAWHCIHKKKKERGGGGGKEERWDWEINFYWAPTMCQSLLDIIHTFYFSNHSFKPVEIPFTSEQQIRK